LFSHRFTKEKKKSFDKHDEKVKENTGSQATDGMDYAFFSPSQSKNRCIGNFEENEAAVLLIPLIAANVMQYFQEYEIILLPLLR